MSRPPLTPLFDPRAVAIVGASADPAKVGGSVLANLRASGFAGRVVPVNCRRPEIQGMAAVPSLRDVEGPIDEFGPAKAILELADQGVGIVAQRDRADADWRSGDQHGAKRTLADGELNHRSGAAPAIGGRRHP